MGIKTILLILLMFGFPLLMIWGENKVKLINWISPIILSYATGLLLANFPFIEINTELSTTISEVMVPLAIPLLLFSTNIIKWLKSAKKAVLSFILCVIAVSICATIGAFIFRNVLENTSKIAGMMVGVYTGGTPNMSAIGLSLGVNEEIFILLNAADLIMGSIYLLFLMTVAKPLLSKFLPKYSNPNEDVEIDDRLSFIHLSVKSKVLNILIFLGVAIVILGIAVGISLELYGSMKAVVIILTVTTIGIALSFVPKVNQIKGSYELGEYFLLVFCIALGSLANISELLSAASYTMYFTAFVMFGSILLHIVFAYFAKIDADTVIITSVAGIYGPAFVGPIAKVLNSKSIILTGMTTGLVGYALGNYLGIGLALLLQGII